MRGRDTLAAVIGPEEFVDSYCHGYFLAIMRSSPPSAVEVEKGRNRKKVAPRPKVDVFVDHVSPKVGLIPFRTNPTAPHGSFITIGFLKYHSLAVH